MSKMNRKQFLLGAMATGTALGISPLCAETSGPLEQVDQNRVLSEGEALAWHRVKDSLGPALTGNESWHHFLEFLEAKLKAYHCVNVHRSSWMFDRIETSNWPDDFKWSLTSKWLAIDSRELWSQLRSHRS